MPSLIPRTQQRPSRLHRWIRAKGYYELLGKNEGGEDCILRFNIQAFRNNYGLVDLGRMQLVFHGIRVGKALESSLSMQEEMAPNQETELSTARELLGKEPAGETHLLDVFDVLLAGVEYDG